MKLEEKDLDIFNKLDSNVYLTLNDKQALRASVEDLARRLREREQRLQDFNGLLLEKDGHIRVRDARIDERDKRMEALAKALVEKEKLLKAKIPCAKRTEDPKSPDQHSALRQNGTAFLFAH